MAMDLRSLAKKHIITVGHRGVAGGNIPCNTLEAYEAALFSGVDMLEVDVTRSVDGKLFIFHPGLEKMHLDFDGSIANTPASEVEKLRYVNADRTPTNYPLTDLDTVFEVFKNRCFINVDKFWMYPKEICDMIKRHNIADQILVKTEPTDDLSDMMEQYAPEIMYMPILRETNNGIHEKLMHSKINYFGAELCFASDDREIVQPEFIERLRRDGKFVWCNTIVYDYRCVISGGHTDDIAMTGDPAKGWGWVADRFDFIQTDWPAQMIGYLKSVGKYDK